MQEDDTGLIMWKKCLTTVFRRSFCIIHQTNTEAEEEQKMEGQLRTSWKKRHTCLIRRLRRRRRRNIFLSIGNELEKQSNRQTTQYNINKFNLILHKPNRGMNYKVLSPVNSNFKLIIKRKSYRSFLDTTLVGRGMYTGSWRW